MTVIGVSDNFLYGINKCSYFAFGKANNENAAVIINKKIKANIKKCGSSYLWYSILDNEEVPEITFKQ